MSCWVEEVLWKGPEQILPCEALLQSLLGFGSHSLDQDAAGLFPGAAGAQGLPARAQGYLQVAGWGREAQCSASFLSPDSGLYAHMYVCLCTHMVGT